MKTFTILEAGYRCNRPVVVDFANNTIEPITSIRSFIDEIYIAPENMEVRYKKLGVDVVVKAKKGDIIIVFYNEPTVINRVVVVKNEAWKENTRKYLMKLAADQAEKETYASLEKCSSCDCDCEC